MDPDNKPIVDLLTGEMNIADENVNVVKNDVIVEESNILENFENVNAEEAKVDELGDFCQGKPIVEEKEEKPIVDSKEKETQKVDEIPKEVACSKCPYRNAINCFISKIPQPVHDLIYWKDLKKTGVVFGASLVLLLSMTYFSIILVLSTLLLLGLSGTLCLRVYKYVLQAIQKNNEGHPFKEYLEMDLTLSADDVKRIVDNSVPYINTTTQKLRGIFLVEDVVDSLKVAVVLWILTYVGSWFNGMTLIILAVIGIFSIPKVYDTYKSEIDSTYAMVLGQISVNVNKVRAMIPIGNKKKD